MSGKGIAWTTLALLPGGSMAVLFLRTSCDNKGGRRMAHLLKPSGCNHPSVAEAHHVSAL